MNWQEWQRYADDARNWRDNNERGLLKAEYLHDFVLRLWFEEELDVTIYNVDFHDLFVEQNPGGVFAPLCDPKQFRLVQGDYALIWPDPESGLYDENSVDLAPECVRFFCERYGRKVKTVDKGAVNALVFV